MPVTARVVGVAGVSAAGTFIDMIAERSGTAGSDCPQYLQVLARDPVAAMFNELLPAARTMSATSRDGRCIYVLAAVQDYFR